MASTNRGRAGRKSKSARSGKSKTKSRATTKARPKRKLAAGRRSAPASRARASKSPKASKISKATKAGAARAKAAARPRPAAPRRTPSPRPDAVRALARRIVEVTVTNDDEAAFALYAEGIESIEPGQPPMRGIDAIRQKFQGWRQMAAEARFEPRRIVVDGNTIMIEWIGHVTLAGSGKRVEMREVAIHEIENGKIARELYYYDPSVLAAG